MAALSRPAISHNKDDSAFSHLFYLERGTDFRTAEKVHERPSPRIAVREWCLAI